MKEYADLHLCPPLNDVPNASSMAKLLTELKTKLVGLVIPPERLTPTPPVVASLGDAGIDVAKRLNLKPKSREELLKNLRRFRSKYEIIAVDCAAPSVSRVAVRDRRVDIVHFPKQGRGTRFRRDFARTCRAALEFNMSELYSGPDFEVRLQRLRGEIEIAAKASVRVVGSSNASSPIELRSPRDSAAVLHVLGLPPGVALKSVSEIPRGIVSSNRVRIGEPLLEEGVRVVRRSSNHE